MPVKRAYDSEGASLVGRGVAIVVCRGALEDLPPSLFVIGQCLRHFNRVIVITSRCAQSLRRSLEHPGLQIVAIDEPETPSGGRHIRKLVAALMFRAAAWQTIERAGETAFIWVASADTAIVLGRRLKRYRFVLQLNELYDTAPAYRIWLRWFVGDARCVVVPDECRAAIFRMWYGLSSSPFVIPNCPVVLKRSRNLPIEDVRAREIVSALGEGTKIVLYQGQLGIKRDMRTVAAVVHELGPEWRFVAMGRDNGFLGELRRACPSAVHIPHINAPHHLAVTSHAYVGVNGYPFTSLNNLFCAPNKIWEYSAFGVPMLGNDVPGLCIPLKRSGAGVCCNYDDKSEIEACFRLLHSNYAEFSERSFSLYGSVDAEHTFFSVLTQCLR